MRRPGEKGGMRSPERWIAWMRSDHALVATFAASFLEMSVVPIPVEVALTPAMIAAPRRRWALALAALAGSVTCAIGWYVLAATWGREVAGWLGAKETIEATEASVRARGFTFVFFAGVTPVPFQVACVAAGLVRMTFGSFVVASLLSRGLRYLGLAVLVAAVGETAQRWLLERKWALGAAMMIVAGVLLGLGAAIESMLGWG